MRHGGPSASYPVFGVPYPVRMTRTSVTRPRLLPAGTPGPDRMGGRVVRRTDRRRPAPPRRRRWRPAHGARLAAGRRAGRRVAPTGCSTRWRRRSAPRDPAHDPRRPGRLGLGQRAPGGRPGRAPARRRPLRLPPYARRPRRRRPGRGVPHPARAPWSATIPRAGSGRRGSTPTACSTTCPGTTTTGPARRSTASCGPAGGSCASGRPRHPHRPPLRRVPGTGPRQAAGPPPPGDRR